MAVEMKFVLLFALLAYSKFPLGNASGAGQCASPCNPVNINVYGKEECVKDPNKPSAHIEAANKSAVTYKVNTVIKDWSASSPHSHLAGGMTYHDGKLTVPTPGRYYIYIQLFYHSKGNGGRVFVRVNNNVVTMVQPLDSGNGQGTMYAGGVFNLEAGDAISLSVVHSITIFMHSVHTYFGAFLI